MSKPVGCVENIPHNLVVRGDSRRWHSVVDTLDTDF